MRILLPIVLALLSFGCSGYVRTVERPVRGTDSAAWHHDAALRALLDEATASHEVPASGATLLEHGGEAFAQRYANLASAQVVLIKTFIITEDDEGKRMADALTERLAEGVPVVLQYDVKGSIGAAVDLQEMLENGDADTPFGEKDIVQALRRAGVWVVGTNPPGRGISQREWIENTKRLFRDPTAAVRRSVESLAIMDHCDHEKMFITVHDDGSVRAIIGGLNIASEYSLGGIPGVVDAVSGRAGWRDTDVELRGDVAREVLVDYIADYERHTGERFPVQVQSQLDALLEHPERAAGAATIRFVANHPHTVQTYYIEDLYRILLQATPAGEPIILSTPYFAPSRVLRDAIIEHGKLGGRVVIVTNSPASSDISVLTDAAHFAAHEILKETDNVEFYEWVARPDDGEHTLHQKVASFGLHGPVVVGSFNLDAQSSIHNTEAVALIDDVGVRAAFDRMVAADHEAHKIRRVTLEELQSAPMAERMRIFLTHELAWYWL